MVKKRRGYERADRVSQQVQEIVAQLFLNEIKDPRLSRLQITDVEMAPDLKNAKVYFITLDREEEPPAEVVEALEGVVGFVRTELAKRLKLKYTPEIRFYFDESIREGRHIDELLSNLRDD